MSTDIRRVLANALFTCCLGTRTWQAMWLSAPCDGSTPGALHRADEFTVAILDVASGSLEFLRVTP